MDPINDSILDSTKAALGIQAEYTFFDAEIIMAVNTALMVLNQLAVGTDGFTITDSSATWSEFEPDVSMLQAIKSVVYLRTRLLFDPPANSFLVSSIDRQIAEYEWRLNVRAEGKLKHG